MVCCLTWASGSFGLWSSVGDRVRFGLAHWLGQGTAAGRTRIAGADFKVDSNGLRIGSACI